MTHFISGTKIKADVQSRLSAIKPEIENRLSQKKVIIFQFDLPKNPKPSDLTAHKAATASTNQKRKIFQDFLGCQFEYVNLNWKTSERARLC
jgi:hypothetical protein